jgi:hypothetical protein
MIFVKKLKTSFDNKVSDCKMHPYANYNHIIMNYVKDMAMNLIISF